MAGRAPLGCRRVTTLVAALAATLSAACATIEPPRGGPEDLTPPRLTAAWPESGAVGLRDVSELRFAFSEKMDPQPAERFLNFYPPLKTRRTEWEGRRAARVILAEPLPADTVVVVEIIPGLADNHKVKSARGRLLPLATADSLPGGEVTGSLILEGKALFGAMVELLPLAPDSAAPRRPVVLRRAQTDSLGRFQLPWLPVPGGPWLLHAFADPNGDGRLGQADAQRLLPDTVSTSPARPRVALALATLYRPNTPGQVAGVVDSSPPWDAPLLGWVTKIADIDTGWTATPQRRAAMGQQAVPRGHRVTWEKVGPGLVRLILFADLDGDSLLSVVTRPPDTTVTWLEPHVLVDSLTVEPGLETLFRAPAFPATLSPWRRAAADTPATAATEPDSAADR